jgi:hypothetical protein
MQVINAADFSSQSIELSSVATVPKENSMAIEPPITERTSRFLLTDVLLKLLFLMENHVAILTRRRFFGRC